MPEAKRPLKVFLSYASQDKPLVRELSRRLAGEGWIDPWVDEKKLLPGQDWRTKIEEAVETSDIVIICLSSNSVSKEGYVQKELRYAREIALEKPEEVIFIIPLRLDECQVPRGLRFYQWVDYFGENKDDSYSALIEALKLRYEQKLRIEELERVLKEKQEREIAERIAQEKVEREAAEKLAREKVAHEKAEKEAKKKARLEAEERARQKAAKEKAERDAAEKVAREKKEREIAEKPKPKVAKPKPVEEKREHKPRVPSKIKPDIKTNSDVSKPAYKKTEVLPPNQSIKGIWAFFINLSIKKDNDGNELFYPLGILSKRYILNSPTKKQEILKFIKLYYSVYFLVFILWMLLVQPYLLVNDMIGIDILIAGIIILSGLIWWQSGIKQIVRALPTTNIKMTWAESIRKNANSLHPVFLWSGGFFSILFVIGGVWMMSIPNASSVLRIFGFFDIIFFGLAAFAYGYMLRIRGQ